MLQFLRFGVAAGRCFGRDPGRCLAVDWRLGDGHRRCYHTIMCDVMVRMATNLNLDPELVDEAVAVGGHRTKKETVTEALREYIARRRQARVTSLFGKVDYDSALQLQKAAPPQMKVLVDTSVWSLALRRQARVRTRQSNLHGSDHLAALTL